MEHLAPRTAVADTLPVCVGRSEVGREGDAHGRHAHQVQRPQHAAAPAGATHAAVSERRPVLLSDKVTEGYRHCLLGEQASVAYIVYQVR